MSRGTLVTLAKFGEIRSSRFREMLSSVTRSTADAVERPSRVNLLRAAVMGIAKHTNLICQCRGSNKYFHLLPRAVIEKHRTNQHAKLNFVRVRYVDSVIRACVSENVFRLYR